MISNSKSGIKQFANHIETEYGNIPTSPIKENYLTEDGLSLSTINEIMIEL